jgi:hypothetical protein
VRPARGVLCCADMPTGAAAVIAPRSRAAATAPELHAIVFIVVLPLGGPCVAVL